MDDYESDVISKARTPYSNLIEVLEGTLVSGNPHNHIVNGKVIIGAANPQLIEGMVSKDDLMIVGDRIDTQIFGIEMGVGCLILCLDAPVNPLVLQLAEERHCSVITTKLDTYTVARLINQSIPIRYFMKKDNLITFQLDETVDSIKEIMSKKRHRDFPIVDDFGHYYGMVSRRNLLALRRKKVILVDHNEKSQAIAGIEDAEICEIIDHHRLGSLQTVSPVYFRNQPVGCTATIIYQMYQESGVEVEPQMAGLLCSAIISDTLLFRSPTCTMVDQAAAEALARIAGIDMEEHAKEMFNAGSNLRGKSVEEICFQDFKVFNVKDIMFGVGQITSMNQDELDEVKGRLIPYLEEARKTQGLHMLYLMMTNILEESTELLCCGENAKEQVLEAFELPGDTEKILLKGVVSRKKQMIPVLVTYLQQK